MTGRERDALGERSGAVPYSQADLKLLRAKTMA